jgi:hypothetical protein
MIEKIKIATINIRSIKKVEKILYLYDLCERNKLDLIFIQETHLNEITVQNEIKKIFFNYYCYFPILSSTYKGIGIVIRNKDNICQIKCEIFDPNRIMNTSLIYGETKFNIINIYSPNDPNEQWRSLYKNFQLEEFEFNNFVNESSFTWKNEATSTRMDRIYFSIKLKDNFEFKYDKLVNNEYWDHKKVIGDIIDRGVIINRRVRKRNYENWKLNDSIFKDEVVDFKMKIICKEIEHYYNENDPSWYDYFINQSRNMLMYESKRIKIRNEKYINDITQELQEWYENGENYKNETINLRIKLLREKIKEYYLNKKKGIEKRNKKIIERFANIPTKKLVEESNLFNERNKINDLVIDNKICFDQKLINNHIFDYHKTIYSLKDSSVNLKDCEIVIIL